MVKSMTPVASPMAWQGWSVKERIYLGMKGHSGLPRPANINSQRRPIQAISMFLLGWCPVSRTFNRTRLPSLFRHGLNHNKHPHTQSSSSIPSAASLSESGSPLWPGVTPESLSAIGRSHSSFGRAIPVESLPPNGGWCSS